MSHPGSILPAPSSFTSWPTVINFGEANLRMYRIFTMNNWYKRLPRRGFVWRRQITFGSNGAEEEWLSQNSTLSSWSTFTAAGTLISLETDWLLWLQQGSITLDPWPLRDGVKKSKWKFKMAFAMKGEGVSRGSRVPHTNFKKWSF